MLRVEKKAERRCTDCGRRFTFGPKDDRQCHHCKALRERYAPELARRQLQAGELRELARH